MSAKIKVNTEDKINFGNVGMVIPVSLFEKEVLEMLLVARWGPIVSQSIVYLSFITSSRIASSP